MANCPMCGELWNNERCVVCGWKEGESPRYTARRDRRKSGEGAIKGWATRRRKQQVRRVALDRLIEVMDSIGGELVTRTPIPGYVLCQAVLTISLVNWRDRISSAVRLLEDK